MVAESAMRHEHANYERVALVMEHLLIEYPQLCRCARCRMDLMNIAINNLPPRYFITPPPLSIEELAYSWFTVEAAVRKALNRLFLHPHHKKTIPSERPCPYYHLKKEEVQ